jgi:hypothetical protein
VLDRVELCGRELLQAGSKPGCPAGSRRAQRAEALFRHLEDDPSAVLEKPRALHEPRRLETIEVRAHGRRRDALAQREVADADPRVRPDRVEERRLAGGDAGAKER